MQSLICGVVHALPVSKRRVFNRAEAASYAGVSAGYFDKLVDQGLLPGPLPFPGVRRWDKESLDLALDAMSAFPRDRETPAPSAYEAWSRSRG